MLYTLLTGEHPFAPKAHQINFPRLSDAILSAPLRERPLKRSAVDLAARKLLTQLLERRPEDRLSAIDALGQEWLRPCSPELYFSQLVKGQGAAVLSRRLITFAEVSRFTKL